MGKTNEEYTATLFAESGDQSGQIFRVDKTPMTIGRSQTADIQLTHQFVSRQHAEIRYDGAKYILRDTKSSNGTALNGAFIEPLHDYHLEDDDVIELAKGFVVLRFRQSERTTIMAPIDTNAKQTSRVRIDDHAREVWVNSQKLEPPLALKEFELLSFLYKNMGTACSKDNIARHVWQDEFVTDEQIEQCMYRLRKKIEADSSNPKQIVTLRGYGYKLCSDSEEE